MTLILNTTLISGQTVVTDSNQTAFATIDYTTLYGRIATALETIASVLSNVNASGLLLQGTTTFAAAGTSISAAAIYTNVTPSASSGIGTGAVFTIQKTGSGTLYASVTTVTVTSPGTKYAVGDTITILGTSLGGIAPANNLTLTIGSSVSTTSMISLLSTIVDKQTSIATDTSTIAAKQTTIADKQTSIATDTNTIARGQSPADIAITTVGALVYGTTTFTTAGTSVPAAAKYTNVVQSTTNGVGSGAIFTIEKLSSSTSYTGITITVTAAGQNYQVGNTITLPGALLGGSTPANNLTLTVGTAVSSTPIINLLKTIADNLTALKTLATEDGLKTVGAFDWTDIAIYLNSSVNNNTDVDLIGRLESLSKKVPRYFK
jgi:hypothetical protein